MGIYDRDYYRREGPSFLESLSGRANVCKWLIIINVGIFFLQAIAVFEHDRFARRGDLVTELFALNVKDVMAGQVWRLVTYSFLHAGIWHILFNMLFLWWFGKDMEELYGWKEFLAFYLSAAVLGGIAYVAGGLGGVDPGARVANCIGASGAVTAVMVLCACHYPTQVIYFFLVPVPIWLFVIFQVAQDLFGVLGGGGTTAYTVHLGGAAFAFPYYKFNWRVMTLVPDFRAWQRRRSRPQLRVYRGEEEAEELHLPTPVPVAAPPAGDLDEHLEAKLDAVLEKVAKHGQSSLTDTEKQILMRASEVFKKRRT